jgi:putative phage-type endonuclease
METNKKSKSKEVKIKVEKKVKDIKVDKKTKPETKTKAKPEVLENLEEELVEDLEEELVEDLEAEFLEMLSNLKKPSELKSNKVKQEGEYDYDNETYKYIKYKDVKYGPFTESWVHDEEQYDDEIEEIHKQRQNIVKGLMEIEYPAQRSEQWFKDRDTLISASDGGCVVGVNKHESPYKFIVKKVFGSTFKSNEFCYHGKKYEQIATMIYENRMNVIVHEFGLVRSKKYSFLGASPDGIVKIHKADGIHLSNRVGRMLEIKCPFIRKIKHDGEIKDHQVPIYYWVQVQLQLQCCELDECDFWQCELIEYKSKEEFLKDTKPDEPWRSLKNNLEKGCVIQLIPKAKKKEIEEGNYLNVIWEDAIFIYPESIEWGPKKIDEWIEKSKNIINTDDKYKDFEFDKVIYWKLETSSSVTVLRDDEWFSENLPILQKMWNYVLFYRENQTKKEELQQYLDKLEYKSNVKIMKFIEDHYNNHKIESLSNQKLADLHANAEYYMDYKDVL